MHVIFVEFVAKGEPEDGEFKGFLPDGIDWREGGGGTEYGEGYVGRQWIADAATDAQVAEFKREWDLDDRDSEPNMGMLVDTGQHLESSHWDIPGDDWNVGGVSPVAWATVRISERVTVGAYAPVRSS